MTSHSHSDHAGHPQAHLLPRLLDLDAEVHAEMLAEAMSWVVDLVGDAAAVTRVLDVGAGTGTGTVALAQRFASARVMAVDVSEGMLAAVRDRAEAHGVADRVDTLLVDVASDRSDLGSAELAWSSMAMHEVGDPATAFGHLFDAVAPGGVVVLVEMDAPSRVLPERLAGLEGRIRSAAGSSPATHHPDWTTALAAAGFLDVTRRSLAIDRVLAADGPAGDYAALELQRLGHSAVPRLDPADRDTLQALVGEGPGGVRGLGELWVRGTRSLWSARRP